MLKKYQQFA